MKRFLRQSSARVLRLGSAQDSVKAWQLPPLPKLFRLGSALSVGDRRARERWEMELVWFRLRYQEADEPTRCLNLLSRPNACGRVALCYQPDAVVSRLYLGIPGTHVRLVERMAVDFDFSLKPMSAAAVIPAMQKMTAAADLPWDRPFLAHIVDNSLFLQVGSGNGRFLPDGKGAVVATTETVTSTKLSMAVWRLPTAPPAGLTQRLSWSEGQLPDILIASAPDPRRWLLGRSMNGLPLHVAGQVNLYGRQEAVAQWLVHQATQMIAIDPTNLIIIDGAGDLVPRLKRKTAVTRLLGKQIVYVDIDGASLVDGFNPLAAVPGEADAETTARWQRWFEGMRVPMQAIRLLPHAQKEGVTDIPALRKWLKGAERQGQVAQTESTPYSSQAISALNAVLNRLTADRSLREWLEWPTKSFDGCPESALLFACKGTGWDREQLLRAVLLAALSMEDVRLIVHGFSWQEVDSVILTRHEQVVIGNGPPLPDSTVILTESHPQGEAMVAARFLSGNALLQENLSLLTRGEGMILVDGDAFFTSWNGQYTGSYTGHQSVVKTRNV